MWTTAEGRINRIDQLPTGITSMRHDNDPFHSSFALVFCVYYFNTSGRGSFRRRSLLYISLVMELSHITLL